MRVLAAAHGTSQYEDYHEGRKTTQALAVAVFRAALRALPASARAWFGDLKDRGLVASVEVSVLTHRHEFTKKPYACHHSHSLLGL